MLTDGVLDGDKDAAKSDGDDVDDKLGDDVVAGWVDSVSNSSLATLGCSVGDDGCATSSSLPVLGFNVSDGRVDIVTSSLFSPLGCNDVGELDDAVVGGVDCVTSSLLSALGCNVVDDVDFEIYHIGMRYASDQTKSVPNIEASASLTLPQDSEHVSTAWMDLKM